eukprot:scaffold5593_cov125-Isochrysis_galbana.AAC.3
MIVSRQPLPLREASAAPGAPPAVVVDERVIAALGHAKQGGAPRSPDSQAVGARLGFYGEGERACGEALGPRGMLVNPTKNRHSLKISSSIVRSKGSRE